MRSTEEFNELIHCTEVNGDNLIEVLARYDDDELRDYVWCWKERIKEEFERRIDTGQITPLRVLSWCIRGIGWKEEVAWEELPKY